MSKSKHISISITERCNLNCIYCFEKSKLNKKMEFETAKSIIEYELLNSTEYESLIVDFMGGEPFLEFDLIKDVCEYYWNRKLEKPILFYTTTNGTLVKGKVKDWLTANKSRFICALSLDGDKISHNINRCDSFDRIDIDFFREMWTTQKVKTIVSLKTLDEIYDNVVFLHQKGFPQIEIKLAYGFDWNDVSICKAFAEQLQMLIPFYEKNLKLVPCSFLNMKLVDILLPNENIKKWCNAGIRTVSYDMDGNRYPCRYFQDLRKSNKLSLGEMWEIDYQTIQNTLQTPCRDCLIRNICRTCYAQNYEVNSSFGKKSLLSCRVSREMAYATAKLYILRCQHIEGEQVDDKMFKASQVIENAYKSNRWALGGLVDDVD